MLSNNVTPRVDDDVNPCGKNRLASFAASRILPTELRGQYLAVCPVFSQSAHAGQVAASRLVSLRRHAVHSTRNSW